MKNLLRKQLKNFLRLLARWMIRKHQPSVIGITGTVGKTSTKEAVAAVLKSIRKVRSSSGNFNNEFGLPLTILGEWEKSGGFFFWLRVIFTSLIKLIFGGKYPEILVLEYGADRLGDLKYLLDLARPQIGVVTAVGDIPAHVEFYSGPDAVAKEKARLVEALPAIGFAVLNYDDEAIYDMRDKTRAHVITYGFGNGAEVRITNFENRVEDGKPVGLSFKLEYGGSFVPVRLNSAFGKAQAYAAAAAAAVGLSFGMNLVRISEALNYYQVPPRRGRLVAGEKGTLIFDDTYNASPLSMHAAIDTMKEFKAARKVAVLGDMLEIGKYAIEAHEEIGRLAAKVFDVLVTVGPRAKFIADAANKSGLSKKNIFTFDFADQAKDPVEDLIKKGDLILIKASRAIGLDKIVEEIRQL
ncbi:MAG: UDP-N-acetylmuramoyl-tripeptide--D-alanyl-D-alanine ligase [Parcubacteria group bacterium Gr01-1014_19]|nr:MAG: UDP-N-acetylmuramoyl-tripeptide--D-alanyl-D-alanine ligase [Parcubacteria group bacterium Gr01-1014_19]